MAHVAPISWKKFDKFLRYVGCEFKREKGDHRVYNRDGLLRPIIVPQDSQIPVFIIRNNLRVLNISTEEYLEILQRI
jgi:predicted RNA binding protein YcfA (HicA-like mRNA interferase family)